MISRFTRAGAELQLKQHVLASHGPRFEQRVISMTPLSRQAEELLPRSIVGDTGLVVPTSNRQALAEAYNRLSAAGASGREALGVKTRKRVEENFGLTYITQQYEILYQGVGKTFGAKTAHSLAH